MLFERGIVQNANEPLLGEHPMRIEARRIVVVLIGFVNATLGIVLYCYPEFIPYLVPVVVNNFFLYGVVELSARFYKDKQGSSS